MAPTHFYYGEPDPPAPNRPLSVTITAIVRHPRDGRVLLDRRADNGLWATLGGAVDPHEQPEDAVVREVAEETGLVVVRQRLVGILADRSMVVAYPDGNVVRQINLVYEAEVGPPGEPRPSDEAHELRYVTLEEGLQLDLVSPARFHLEQLAARSVPFVG